jgi:hypothetical protein
MKRGGMREAGGPGDGCAGTSQATGIDNRAGLIEAGKGAAKRRLLDNLAGRTGCSPPPAARRPRRRIT